MTLDVPAFYRRFLELGGPPPGEGHRPWAYRRSVTSLRLAGCLVLAELVRSRKPAGVLDLGSGITTLLLRELEREVPGMWVVTTDLSAAWLATTRAELRRDGLDLENLHLQGEFERIAYEPFDLVSVDIGNLTYRVEAAAKIASWLSPSGILVLDDWHMEPYPQRMTEALEALGFTITVRSDSIDEAGGFIATAERIP